MILRCTAGASANAWLQPAQITIVEGIHAFYDPRVRAMMDFKLFVQVDPDICLLRRIRRDIRDRGRDVDDISRQYLDTVKPMYERHIRNYVDYADVIVAHGGKNQRSWKSSGTTSIPVCFPIENRGNAFGKIWHGSKGFGKRVFVVAHFNQQRGRADVLVIAIALYHHIAAQARMPRV